MLFLCQSDSVLFYMVMLDHREVKNTENRIQGIQSVKLLSTLTPKIEVM